MNRLSIDVRLDEIKHIVLHYAQSTGPFEFEQLAGSGLSCFPRFLLLLRNDRPADHDSAPFSMSYRAEILHHSVSRVFRSREIALGSGRCRTLSST